MKNALCTALCAGVGLFFLNSCASIVSSSSWPLVIGTQPTEASVSVTNRKGKEIYRGSTPAVMSLKSGSGFFMKESYKIRLTMAGYEEKIVTLDCKLNGWYAGNILIGGLIGLLIVDPATGAMFKLNTDAIHEVLQPVTAQATPSLKLMNLDEVPEALKSKLVKLN